MIQVRAWIFGVFALLSAGVAEAEGVREPYARVGDWEINAVNHRECGMLRSFAGSVADEFQLLLLYDAQRKVAALTWATSKPPLPTAASLDLYLTFTRKGSPLNEKWGSQPFQFAKLVGGYSLTHVFGSADSDRFLRDLASSDTIGLWLGPTLMTGLPLGAADAVIKLRDCASKIVKNDASDRVQK
jgi:hypothetical protein